MLVEVQGLGPKFEYLGFDSQEFRVYVSGFRESNQRAWSDVW